MTLYATESGVAITFVRVSNFRSLTNVEVALGDLTVLIGANNAGKTSFLDALYAAVGSGRKSLGAEDVHLAPGEAVLPKEREAVIDVLIRPIGADGKTADIFPVGSFWIELWGSNIFPEPETFDDVLAFRTSIRWSISKGDYVVDRRFLKEWPEYDDWLAAEVSDKSVTAAQIEPIALHYIDAKRDLEDDLRRPGSFWRRLTDDLGLPSADVKEIEDALTEINAQIVDKSEVLKHLRSHLRDLQEVVSADSDGIDVSPVARRLRDLSRGVDVSFSTTGAQPFPLARHGMGTRSLASLLVFRAFAAWKSKSAIEAGSRVHPLLALEEPESHLHPQAQRSLFAQIKRINGQRVVSTHSPYFAGQAQLEDLRLFIKRDGISVAAALDLSQLTNADDRRKLQETVIESRGDILFASGMVLFEGQTEEQALPIWAEAYWGATIHELGLSFVRANGTQYFPFVWLAKSFNLPWYIFADGEPKPVADLDAALARAGEIASAANPQVTVIPHDNNFETMLLAEGYLPEIEHVLNEFYQKPDFLSDYIGSKDGSSLGPGKGVRDFKGPEGRMRAAAEAMKNAKTKLAKPLARAISKLPDEGRRFPGPILALLAKIGAANGLNKSEAPLA